MAKKQVTYSLASLKAQIKKAQKGLRDLKPKASVTGKKQIDMEIQELKDVLEQLSKGCKGTMTHAFDAKEARE
jgi:hypothetical protein